MRVGCVEKSGGECVEMVRVRGKNGGETIGEQRVLGQVWRVIVEEEDHRENERMK